MMQRVPGHDDAGARACWARCGSLNAQRRGAAAFRLLAGLYRGPASSALERPIDTSPIEFVFSGGANRGRLPTFDSVGAMGKQESLAKAVSRATWGLQPRAFFRQNSSSGQRKYCRKRRNEMAWTAPVLVEICAGLEINGYLPSEI